MGVKIEGTCRAHQVPAKDVRENPSHLKLVEDWLKSYHLDTLFDQKGSPKKALLELCPKGDKRMGSNPHTFGSKVYKRLELPNIKDFEVKEEDSLKEFIRGRKYFRNVKNALLLHEVYVRKKS